MLDEIAIEDGVSEQFIPWDSIGLMNLKTSSQKIFSFFWQILIHL